MSRNYKFNNPKGIYFVSFATVKWVKALNFREINTIIIEALKFYQKNKDLEIFSWCIMPNHIHLIFRSQIVKPEQLLGHFKRYTSKQSIEIIKNIKDEELSTKLLKTFSDAASKSANVNSFQFWQHNNHPIELWSNKLLNEKLNYIHKNPVKAGIVTRAEDYNYSSAIDYADGKGMLEVIKI